MLKIRLRPRHLFIGLLGGAVLISTIGSILETLDFNDINKAPVVSTPTARKAWIEDFQLESASQASNRTDPQDATPVSVVQETNITFSAHVVGVRDFFVMAGAGQQEPVVSARSQPDANGKVSVSLKLPRTNTTYTIQGVGIVNDKLRPGWSGGSYDNVPAVSTDTPVRVMAK